MKSKYAWYDDNNTRWHVKPQRVIHELVFAPTYRWPMKVTEMSMYKGKPVFPRCPRCGTTMEREYQHFCDRCGQRLDWRKFGNPEAYGFYTEKAPLHLAEGLKVLFQAKDALKDITRKFGF